MNEGTKAIFRGRELVTIVSIRTNPRPFKTCGTNFVTRVVEAGTVISCVVEFEDGERHIAAIEDLVQV